MSGNSLIKHTTDRLGVHEDVTLQKTQEYLRVFQNKGTLKNLNDVAKIVLCLDLASANLNAAFDKESAIKLSGLKKSAYENNLNTVTKLLALDKPLTIAELCVQLSCVSVKETAEAIFSNYKKTDNKIKDLQHPQYIAAAVYAACRVKNVKVPKAQFTSASHLKPSQWKELSNEFEKFTASMGLNAKRKKDSENNLSEVKNEGTETENMVHVNKQNEEEEEEEDYESWRERILKEAYVELKKIEMDSAKNEEEMEEEE